MSSSAPNPTQPEWRSRKRRGEYLQKEAVRRCPSYLDTEVKDPAYLKVQSLVDNYCNDITNQNATEKTREFVLGMENYMGTFTSDKSTGSLLLSRMSHRKKLAMLVTEKMKAVVCAGAYLDEVSNPLLHESLARVEASLAVNFKNLQDPSWKRAFKHMNVLCSIVKIRKEQESLQRNLAVAAKGGSFVAWSDDDDF